MIEALVLTAGAVILAGDILGGRWLQSSAKVTSQDGTRYKVLVGPEGVAPIATYTNWDMSAWLVPYLLVRYLVGKGKKWTVQVKATRGYDWGPLLAESFSDRKDAWARFDEVVAGVTAGSLTIPKVPIGQPRHRRWSG